MGHLGMRSKALYRFLKISKRAKMIIIEDDLGSQGGQVLRTALSLSAITQENFKISNIRAKRNNPGLQNQHLNAVNIMKEICNAEVRGNQLNSKDLIFMPNDIISKDLKIDIKTAGSVTLVFQTILPLCLKFNKKIKVEIIGGTDVSFSPPINSIENVFLRLVKKFNVNATAEIINRGFYPKGNGKVVFEIEPCRKIKNVELIERGNYIRTDLFSIASNSLKERKVVERQIDSFKKSYNKEIGIVVDKYVDTLSPGSLVHAHCHFTNTIIGAECLGERGKSSEDVGKEAAFNLSNEYNSRACVDKRAIDQLMIYMGLSKNSKVKTSETTNHINANAAVIEKFLDVKFDVNDNIVECSKM